MDQPLIDAALLEKARAVLPEDPMSDTEVLAVLRRLLIAVEFIVTMSPEIERRARAVGELLGGVGKSLGTAP